jgi:RNA polymerase sigma-70 factor (ECF subfamily)
LKRQDRSYYTLLKITHRNREGLPDGVLLEYYRSNGDLKILGELYQRYMHLVFGLCLKYLQNREDARDAVMQVFEKLITEVSRHEIQNFKSWLYVLAKNHCLMQIRSDKSMDKKMDRWIKDQEDYMEFYPDLHPIDETGNNGYPGLKECIEELKEEQRTCIELFYYQNKSYREIAQTLEMGEKKVKSYLQNAKRNLKICLEEKNVREE